MSGQDEYEQQWHKYEDYTYSKNHTVPKALFTITTMNITRKSIEPFKAIVSFGLNKGYTDELVSKDAIIREINNYQKRLADEKGIYLSISISETIITLIGQKEPHLVFNFINYPRFPLNVQVLKQNIERLIEHLMSRFQQNRVVIEYLDETVMLEFSNEVDPKITQ